MYSVGKPEAVIEATAHRRRAARRLRLGVAVLAGVWLLAAPMFLCMAPWVDSTFFDICARALLRGETLYHSIFLHGPPGMVFAQAGVRAVCGWRSEVLRAVDLAVVAACVGLLVGVAQPPDLAAAIRVWAAVLMSAFYFSTSEWNHCQPDTWMLLPSLVALCLRERQAEGIAGIGGALAEGVCWGIGFCIKPFVAIPAFACWVVAASWRREQGSSVGNLAKDGLATVAGGLAVIAPILVWLHASGNWPDFIEALRWNDDYFQHSNGVVSRTRLMFQFGWPWCLLHLIAVPVALVAVIRAVRKGAAAFASLRRALLATFYLGWLVQANYLQRQLYYQVTPAVVLAIAVVAGEPRLWRPAAVRFLVLPACVVFILAWHPLCDVRRLALWHRCWSEGSSAELRDLLTMEIDQRVNPSWREMARAADYLRGQGVADRELTCYSLSAVPLYKEMDLTPSTRFVLLSAAVRFFPSHRAAVRAELAACPQRFVVTDARDKPGPVKRLPFPWSEPVVHTSGRYEVRAVRSVSELAMAPGWPAARKAFAGGRSWLTI